MKIKIQDLIEMVYKVDDIFHDHSFVVDHDILGLYLLEIIRESYPHDDVELEKPDLS